MKKKPPKPKQVWVGFHPIHGHPVDVQEEKPEFRNLDWRLCKVWIGLTEEEYRMLDEEREEE